MDRLEPMSGFIGYFLTFIFGLIAANWSPVKDILSTIGNWIYRQYTKQNLKIISHEKIEDFDHQIHDTPPTFIELREHKVEIKNVSDRALKYDKFEINPEITSNPYVVIYAGRFIECLNLDNLNDRYPYPVIGPEDAGNGFLILQPNEIIEINIQTPREEVATLGELHMTEYRDSDSRKAKTSKAVKLSIWNS